MLKHFQVLYLFCSILSTFYSFRGRIRLVLPYITFDMPIHHFGFFNQALLFVLLVDVVLMSKICLMVNHLDTLYCLLFTCVLAVFLSDLSRAQY